MAKRGPATISAEAEAILAAAQEAGPRDLSKPVKQLRAEARAAYAPSCEAAVTATGVTLSEAEVAGVHCMVIDPPQRQEDRHILYLFGGGYTLGSPFEDLPISASLAVKTGARVIAPHYPLAPEHPYPAALNACTDVARALLADHPNTCLAGESAGGNLSLALTHALRAEGGPLPRAMALMSPATDMAAFGDSQIADRDPFIRAADSEFFRAHYIPQGHDLTDPGLSPIHGPFDAGYPPVMMTSGTRDLLLSGCIRLDRVMRDAGAVSELRIWEGMWHVFVFYPDVPEADASLTELADFLNARFN